MEVKTHPADEIPAPGLWDGAPVRMDDHTDDGDPWPRDGVWVAGSGIHAADSCPLVAQLCPDVALRLDDPLGLGLAGLAARVAKRLGEPFNGDAEALAWDLCDRSEEFTPDARRWPFPLALDEMSRTGPHDDYPEPCLPMEAHEVVKVAASYLALTDRLCAAADLPLAPGTVAILRREVVYPDLPGIWIMEGLENPGDRDPWLLTLPPNGQHQHDDPLTALRAALAALETDHG